MREKLLNLVESLGENWPIPCSNSLEGERPFVVVERPSISGPSCRARLAVPAEMAFGPRFAVIRT